MPPEETITVTFAVCCAETFEAASDDASAKMSGTIPDRFIQVRMSITLNEGRDGIPGKVDQDHCGSILKLHWSAAGEENHVGAQHDKKDRHDSAKDLLRYEFQRAFAEDRPGQCAGGGENNYRPDSRYLATPRNEVRGHPRGVDDNTLQSPSPRRPSCRPWARRSANPEQPVAINFPADGTRQVVFSCS